MLPINPKAKCKKCAWYLHLTAFLILSVSSLYGSTSDAAKPVQKESVSLQHSRELNKSIDEYKILANKSLAYRAHAVNIAKRLKEKISQDQPLSGNDLDRLNQGMVEQLKLREKIFNIAYKYEQSPKIFKQPDLQLKGIMLSLSASLLLYDNYLLMVSIYEDDETLRRFLNERDSGYKIRENKLSEVTKSYNSILNRKRMREAISFYEKNKKSMDLSKDKRLEYLTALIEQSISYNMTRNFSPQFVVVQKLKFMHAFTKDFFYKIVKYEIDQFSKLFGNSVGMVATRKGKLYNNENVFEHLTNQLCAGDILLEKTPFRLTDKFIPGHWGHAAIWVGTEEELKKLGIWEHTAVTPYHKKIKNGHCIVEALRPGVELNSLRHFLNIDDIAIVRCPQLDKKILAERIILSLRQVGKEYDFNFDVETTDKIVCSELIYTVYIEIDWPTDKSLGRYTISPDNVAEKTFDNGPLELVTFYHDGSLVTNTPLLLMKKLMEGAN